MSVELGRDNVIFVHTTLVPYLSVSKELKTKPTQHSVKELMGLGITPNFIVLRAEHKITDEIKEKIALQCTIEKMRLLQQRMQKVFMKCLFLFINKDLMN